MYSTICLLLSQLLVLYYRHELAALCMSELRLIHTELLLYISVVDTFNTFSEYYFKVLTNEIMLHTNK